ncbi:unnamed protein product [Malus fusca]
MRQSFSASSAPVTRKLTFAKITDSLSKRRFQISKRHLLYPDVSAYVTCTLNLAEITGNLSKISGTMERDMALESIQAQLAQLTAQLTQNAGRTTMPSGPTFDMPYEQGFQTHQYPQFSANEDVWGYQGYNQSRGNMFSNAYNSDWRSNSEYMWDEPQQFQQGGYWQQDEFYSRPMQPPQHPPQQFQSNSSMPINYNEILDGLISLAQGSQNQAEETHQAEYWQPSEEYYQWPYEPPQPPPQSSQPNSGTSSDNDILNKLLTSLTQDVENRNMEMQNKANKVDALEEQVGQIMEFIAQIRDQGDMEDEVVPEPSKQSPNMDELPIQEEDEDDDLGSLEEFLSQTPQVLMFLNPKEEVNEKDVVEALPEVKSDIQTLGAPNHVPDDVETFKEISTPRRGIPENEVAGKFVEHIKEAVHETIKPTEVETDDTGQATTIIINLAKFKVPEMFQDVAPSLELRPLSDHFKYHRPFNDKPMHLNNEGRPRNHPQSDLHS